MNDLTNTPEGYGTHLEALKVALNLAPPGPVLELGMGHHSTPFLRKWCNERRIELTSGEHDMTWAEKVCSDGLPMADLHRIIQVPEVAGMQCPDWNMFPFDDQKWSVALVDQHPSAARLVAISALKYQARYIVVHDTEQPLYYYEWLFQTFKFRRDFKDAKPWTTVLSEYAPIPY